MNVGHKRRSSLATGPIPPLPELPKHHSRCWRGIALFHERFTEVRPTKKVQTPGHCRQQRLAILSSLKVRISLSISFSRFVYVRMHFRTSNMVQLPDTQDRKSFIIHNYSYHANLSKPNPSCVLCLCAPCILIRVVFVLKWISLLRKCNLHQFTWYDPQRMNGAGIGHVMCWTFCILPGQPEMG